jgi:hypothetical protein
MSPKTRLITLPQDLIQKAAACAARRGVSTERWVELALTDRLRDEEVTDRFFRHPPNRDAGKRMMEILNSSNDNPPMPGDALE